MPMFHIGQNRIKQSSESKSWQSLGVAVATTKFLFGMCDCTVDSAVGKGDFSILHLCGHAHVRSHVSLGMDCSCPPPQ